MHSFVGLFGHKEVPTSPNTETAPVAAATSQIDVQASQNPAHPNHSFHFGQIIATALLTLSEVQKAKTAGADVFLDSGMVKDYLTGIAKIWIQPAA